MRLEWLGTEALSWRDLLVIVRRAPAGSPIHQAVDPDGARWASGQVVAFLLAHVADLLAAGNWQRGGDVHAPKPKPIPRPGVRDQSQTFGSDPIRIADFDDWWNGGAENG